MPKNAQNGLEKIVKPKKQFYKFDLDLDLEKLDLELENKKVVLAKDYLAILEKLGFIPCLNTVLDNIYLYSEKDKKYIYLNDNFSIFLFEKVKIILAKKYDRKASKVDFDNALTTGAFINDFDPIKTVLESKEWDQKPRLESFLNHFKDTNKVFSEYFKFWLFGSLERLYNKGGFQNPVLVLDGKQGMGKSFLAEWIAKPFDNYFKCGKIDPKNKDGKLDLVENFVFEWGETSNINKKDINSLKQILTQTRIKEREAYARYKSNRKVIANIISTKNFSGGFLRDITGNRRYNIVSLESINKGYSKDSKPLDIWLEALHLWKLDTEKSWIKNFDTEKRDLINKGYEETNPLFDLLDEVVEPLAGGFLPINSLYKRLENEDKSFSRRLQSKNVVEYFLSKYTTKKTKSQKTETKGKYGFSGFILKTDGF